MNPELHYKGKLEEFYQEKINNVIIRGKCDWYEDWKKSFSFLLILKKGMLFKIKLEQSHVIKKK